MVRSVDERVRLAGRSQHAAAEVAAEAAALSAFPGAALEVLEPSLTPGCTDAQICAALAADPWVAARVLRIANSRLFAEPGRAAGAPEVVGRLGRARLADLAIAVGGVRALECLPNDIVGMTQSWSHGLCCAVLAERLAERLRPALATKAFCAGLLHDLGQLVLFARRPSESLRVLAITSESGQEISTAEAEVHVLGFDHAAVGAALARAWHLPEAVLECVDFHHAPGLASRYADLVSIVHVANALAFVVENRRPVDAFVVDSIARKRLGPFEEGLQDLVLEARERFAELRELLF
jgi:putative nucleotidyltransferase with HDIG domain